MGDVVVLLERNVKEEVMFVVCNLQGKCVPAWHLSVFGSCKHAATNTG